MQDKNKEKNIEENDSASIVHQRTQLKRIASMGWYIFPIFGVSNEGCLCGNQSCGSAGKHPITPNGMNSASCDEVQIDSWFDQFPNCNWAVNCKLSGLVCLDIDPRSGGLESIQRFEELLEGNLPSTVESLTGKYRHGKSIVRGRHLYFSAPDGQTFLGNLNRMKLPGIDIKHNGYTVLPNSSHASGVDYEWVGGRDPWSIKLAAPPLLIIKGNTPQKKDDVQIQNGSESFQLQGTVEATEYALRALDSEVKYVKSLKSGNRNNGLNSSAFRMGQFIGGHQISIGQVRQSLLEAAEFVFDDPSEADSVLRIVGGALEKGAEFPLLESQSERADSSTSIDAKDSSYWIERWREVDWHELWMRETVNQWLVPGIVAKYRAHVLYSDAGVGKSLLALDISAALASGKSCLGHSPIEPIKVVYLDHENDDELDVKPRLMSMGYAPEDLSNLTLLTLPEFAPLDTEDGSHELDMLLEIYNPDMVVIDTTSRTIQGKENDNDTWLNFYKYAGKKFKSRKVTYIRLDHTGKDQSAGQRGGSAKKGDVDMIWFFRAGRNENFILTNEKSRGKKEKKEIHITRMDDPLCHVASDANGWSYLYARAKPGLVAADLIYQERERSSKANLSYRTIYENNREFCKENKISRDLLESLCKNLDNPEPFDLDDLLPEDLSALVAEMNEEASAIRQKS